MVIIETALIGGAGYAAWRGGEKAAHVGARKVDDMKRDRRRNEESRGFSVRQRDRSERLSQLEAAKTAAQSGRGDRAGISSAENTATTASATNHESLQKDRFSSIKERYSEARKPVKKKGFFSKLSGSTSSKKKASK